MTYFLRDHYVFGTKIRDFGHLLKVMNFVKRAFFLSFAPSENVGAFGSTTRAVIKHC